MRLAIINGSLRLGRQSIHVSKFIYNSLIEIKGCEVELLDIKDYDFPVMEERMRFLEEVPDNMRKFSQILDEADGIIVVSPEYNGGISGALKNTLDYFKSEYERKPMGLVAVSGGKMGGANVMHHLQAWAIHVKGIVSPYKLHVGDVAKKFSSDGELLDTTFDKKISGFLENMIWLTEAISNQKTK